MISSMKGLREALDVGYTIARMAGFEHASTWRWVITEDGEQVAAGLVKRLVAKGELEMIQSDLIGEPAQYALRRSQ